MFGRKIDVTVADGTEVPQYAHEGDAGLDLAITKGAVLKPGERRLLGTGVAAAIPSGCVGLVFPRSGLAFKRGVTLPNSVGVIDSGYRGEIGVPLVNISDEDVRLTKGERVCQLIVIPFVPCVLGVVDSLDDTERGTDGFGSTGEK